jgi:hypothetical protein
VRWKNFFQEPLLICALAFSFISSSIPIAQSSPVILYSAVGSGCNTSYANGYLESNRWIATRDITIGAINYVYGTQSTSNFLTSRLYIFSDNPTNNFPNTILSTFTPDVISGGVERFVGNQTITSGTKFWVVPSVNAAALPWCYWPGITTSNMTLNGVVPDTSTSLSNSIFRKVYHGATSPPIAGTWNYTGDASQIWQISMEEAISQFAGTISVAGGIRSTPFRTQISIVAAVNISSRVTFYSNKKPIPKCQNLLSSGGTVSCNWSPSVIGVNRITAKFVSVDSSFSDNTSAPLEISVTRRTTTR